ncbi:MAG: leucine-rich repeat domain-containing protein [Pseudomonadota bacterium]
MIISLLGLCLQAQAATDCAIVTEITTAECETLITLYNSTDGDHWSDNIGWNVTNTPCDWYGITCDGGHVTELELDDNQLNGSIPVELGNLSSLQYLGLSENQLSGSIPPELSHLNDLQWLTLDGNQLSGSIPPELANLINLENIYLNDNQLSGSIPTELGNLINLERLDLSFNQLSVSISAELGNLNNLKYLWLNNNHLCGNLPVDLMNLNLLILDINDNHLVAYDPALIAWLNNHDPDWNTTQTACPIPNRLQFTSATYSAIENAGQTIITVTRAEGSNGAISVDYATSDDYTATSGTLNWADDDTADKTFIININDDSLVEGDETVTLSLNNATGGAELGTPYSAILTITDNDSTVNCATVTEIPSTECEALVAIYNSTDGEQWSDNTRWTVTTNPCSWYGIECQNGHLTRLYLHYNQLSGFIPE